MCTMHAALLQSCPTLWDPMDYSPPGFSVHGILQARTLEWVAVPSSRDLPNAGIKLMSLTAPHWQVGSLALAPPGKPKRSDFFQAPVALDLPVGWECVEQSTKQYLTLSSSTQLFCAPCHSNSTILFMTSHWNDFCMYVFSLDWKLW